jgi:peptide-methionine (S)-S-oxide reductase
MFLSSKSRLPTAENAMPGRATAMPVPPGHFVNGNTLSEPFPAQMKMVQFGMGCFWGAEKKFWQTKGVFSTQVGYAAGLTPNPTYREVCSGMTGHNEVVRVVFDPGIIDFGGLLQIFWENHDPTQGMRQGSDVGTQYRSGIYTYDETQYDLASQSRDAFAQKLGEAGHDAITTEILAATTFYFAEDYHQQYLAKNPDGYCGLGGVGIACPGGLLGSPARVR